MDYSSEDLNRVRLKKNGRGIHELDIGVDLVEAVEELIAWDDFHYGFFGWANTHEARVVVRNRIIRYVNFMYSMELTCIRNKVADWKSRKVACAILAGFEYDPNKGTFTKEVEDMLACKDKYVNRMIITFLRHQYSTRFAMITILLEKFYRGMDELMQQAETTPKDLMAWKETGEQLEEMMFTFLGGDKSAPLTAALVMKIEEETLGWRPEEIAGRIKEGQDPLQGFDVYGKDQ